MKHEYLVYISGAFLMLLWTVLVFTGHADKELIDEIRYMLMALGFVHGATNLQRVQPQDKPTSTTKETP
jgi:hypothetical protein